MRFPPPTSIASGLGSALDKPEPLKQTLKHHNSITQTQALNRANGQPEGKPGNHRNHEPEPGTHEPEPDPGTHPQGTTQATPTNQHSLTAERPRRAQHPRRRGVPAHPRPPPGTRAGKPQNPTHKKTARKRHHQMPPEARRMRGAPRIPPKWHPRTPSPPTPPYIANSPP